MTRNNLLVELQVEELPPKALKRLGEAFASQLVSSLAAQGLCADGDYEGFASPRRLAVRIPAVLAQAADKPIQQKLMPVSVGLDANGAATPALLKKLAALGADARVVSQLQRQSDGKAEVLLLDSITPGASLQAGLQKALEESLAKLPTPKQMAYQLQDGWTTVNFVRPAHNLVALYGSEVVAISVLGLNAGRTTLGHRFEAATPTITLQHADDYATQLAEQGAVIASFDARRAEIMRQLQAAAATIGLQPIDDEALLDEVTALVERPNVLRGQFEPEFLSVPQECLILTMKANQKYFPLLDAAGKLTNHFLIVSNIRPTDASAVIQGNERVVRPRLADARFFFDQDRKKTLADRVGGLDKVVYHNKLGSQGTRSARVVAIATGIAQALGYSADDVVAARTAAQLAKADLLTDMVGEFPELQGIMGGYYALHDGLGETLAAAIEDHYKPRFAGDTLPRNPIGIVVALADKLETLVGLFGIGQLPSGDKDPFALRRHALGVLRMLSEAQLDITLPTLLDLAQQSFADQQTTINDVREPLTTFLFERLAGSLREQGYSAQEVDAVLSLRPSRLGDTSQRLAAVRAFASLPEAPALAAANKRVGNILKKVEGELPHNIQPSLLQENAEQLLAQSLNDCVPRADAAFIAGDYSASLQTLAGLKGPIDAFFEQVMVNAEDAALRQNRLALLNQLYRAMNQVAELAKLSS